MIIPPDRSQPLQIRRQLSGENVPTDRVARFFEDVVRALDALQIIDGTGSPEGVVTAGFKKLYLDTAANTLYIKTTATGDTGWALL